MRKTRSDSFIDGLPQNQQDAIERWLCDENLSYKDCISRCFQDFSIRVSKDQLRKFYNERAQARTIASITDSAKTSRHIVDEFRKNQSQVFDALLELIGQTAFEMKLRGEKLSLETLKDLTEMAAIGLKAKTDAKKIQQKDAEIRLAWEKFTLEASEKMLQALNDKRAQDIATSNATNAEKIQQLRQTYFADVDALQKSGQVKLPE